MIMPHYIPRIYSYIRGFLKETGNDTIAIGGTDNHIHILFALSPIITVADLVKNLKTSSTKFINENLLCPHVFAWQRGYACFSYSHSQLPKVKNYIARQMEHHKNCTLQDEIKRFLSLYEIEYDERYIFDNGV